MRKGVLKIRMHVFGLLHSTHTWNLSELGPHWQGISVRNIAVDSFKIPKNSNQSEIAMALRGTVVRRN